MRTRSSQWKWLVALLAASLIVFAVGCEDDDDDDPVGPSVDPNAPSLNVPENGATVDLKEIADAGEDLKFKWEEIEEAVSYEIQIAAAESFSISALLTEDTIDTNVYVPQINNFTIDGAHYWRVRSVLDEEGTDFSDWSRVYDFTPVADPIEVTEVLNGDITANKTFTTGNTYLLRGGVFVQSGVTLTIQAGVTVYGEAATDGMLVIARGGKIDAQGTAEAPIVFTSDRPVGSRGRGDWGGVIINGAAPLNTGAEAYGEGDTGVYGGTNENDNSGTMRYCRIEFAGREISPDNELNGLALQGVGSGTTIEYIQIHMNQDDGIEFFGGTANARYIYVTGAADDQFDWTDGWHGKGQFWVCQQYADDANRGMECDNNGDAPTNTPYSNPTIANFTLIGAAAGDRGMLLRAGTKGTFYNGIVKNFTDYGVYVDGDPSISNVNDGSLVIKNSIFDNDQNYFNDSDKPDEAAASEAIVTAEANANSQADPQLTSPLSVSSPDFTPVTDGLAATKEAATIEDSWFEDADFIGGVNPDNNWLTGWTTSDQN